jgi:hypothetical protein
MDGGSVFGSVNVKLVYPRFAPGGFRIIQTPVRSRAGAGLEAAGAVAAAP